MSENEPRPESPELTRFRSAPHRTIAMLSLPVMFSLIAEPLTGLVDTAFVAQLGDAPLAALGVGTVLFSSLIWVFNFLGIGTQTEVAHAVGADARLEAREAAHTALVLSLAIGTALAICLSPFLGILVRALGADGSVETNAVIYIEIRMLGAPAVLAMIAAFGALRGLHDMQTPFRIAVLANALNAALDALLIPGLGPIPSFGVAGAAWATVGSQWIGAIFAIRAMHRSLGRAERIDWQRARALFVVARDLFFRTGLLIGFTLLTTRAATRLGEDAGAAHQIVRQAWMLSAFALDAFAAAAQTLVGSFSGAGEVRQARRAAGVGTVWALGTGFVITLAMLATTGMASNLLTSASAKEMFRPAWWLCAGLQPISALSFVTDGIHWGTRDYRFLRNAMAISTGFGAVLLIGLEAADQLSLLVIWSVTLGWISLRAGLGIVRVWPGIGDTPLRSNER